MYKTSRLYFLFLSILLLSFYARGKAVLLNENAGLNNIEVTCIAKDKSGLMWVGTKRGLTKYDGYRFYLIEAFRKQTINTLLYDSLRDVLWVGTDLGLYYIGCTDLRIITCTNLLKKTPIRSLLMYNQKVIVGYHHRYILQISPDFSCKVLYQYASAEFSLKAMIIDGQGNIYCAFNPLNTVVRIDAVANKTSTIVGNSHRSIDILVDIEGELYAGGVNIGFWNTSPGGNVPWYFDTLNAIRQDPECLLKHHQLLLIGYRNSTRLYEVSPETKQLTNLSAQDNDIFSNKRIYCLYRDEFDVSWIGTSKGLIKLSPDKPKIVFEQLLTDSKEPVSTRQIVEDENGDIYMGTYAGFFKYDKRKKEWKKWSTISFLGKERPFSPRSLLNCGKRYIYVGSDANYFGRFDKYTQSFELLSYQSADGLCNTKGSILSLAQDLNGVIWLGSENGLISLDTKRSEIKCHTNDSFSVNGSVIKYIYMMPDKKQFWVGTERGLFLMDINSGQKLHLDENTVPALSDNTINVIMADPNGNIWIGTDMGGLNVLSPDYKTLYTITKKDGLSSNEVYHFLMQDSNRLWISTYNGLDYYHIPSKTIIAYYEKDGITNNEFNQNSALKSSDGTLYFGGINGVTAFVPPEMNISSRPFKIIISGITKWDQATQSYQDVSIEENNRITVQPGDNLLTFSFAGTDFTSPELNTYFYKIEGLHADWISLGAQPLLRLESLRGGEHRLLVKAIKGSRGEASLNMLTYDIIVGQEFYQTIWFYLLLALLLAVIIYLYFLNRLNTQKKLELLRVRIASNLHDDVGSLLTRITMSADRLITRMPRDSETRDKLEGVSELSRAANAAMSDVLWTIDARNDVTGSLTDRMREHAEDLLLPKGIETHIHFTDVDPQEKLSPEFRQNLFLVYKELINNITKHSQATEVTIVYKQQKDGFMLSVKNDGAKISEGPSGTGLGLRNIQMRAAVLKAKASVKQEDGIFEVLLCT